MFHYVKTIRTYASLFETENATPDSYRDNSHYLNAYTKTFINSNDYL